MALGILTNVAATYAENNLNKTQNSLETALCLVQIVLCVSCRDVSENAQSHVKTLLCCSI